MPARPEDPELALPELALPELALPELVLELALPELALPELALPELALPELVAATPEFDVVALEPGVVLPKLELVPPVFSPPVPEPVLPFVAAAAVEDVSLAPPEQPPAAASARIAAPASDPGRAMGAPKRERRVPEWARFIPASYYVQPRWSLPRDDGREP
ncbi:MAG: hypothetical protein ABSC94_19230 [Polyangiaceae bacterium]|jgi:hypothetical protein